jgi:hypothetical protein
LVLHGSWGIVSAVHLHLQDMAWCLWSFDRYASFIFYLVIPLWYPFSFFFFPVPWRGCLCGYILHFLDMGHDFSAHFMDMLQSSFYGHCFCTYFEMSLQYSKADIQIAIAFAMILQILISRRLTPSREQRHLAIVRSSRASIWDKLLLVWTTHCIWK